MEQQIKFVHTRTQQALVWLVALLVTGTLLWGFGDLLPIG